MSWTPPAGARGEARPRRRRNLAEERQRLRRITVAVAVAATGLNAALLLQSAAGPLGAHDLGQTIVALINSVFPDSGLGPPAGAPSPAPAVTPHAITGAS